jgi:hypothetical protein
MQIVVVLCYTGLWLNSALQRMQIVVVLCYTGLWLNSCSFMKFAVVVEGLAGAAFVMTTLSVSCSTQPIVTITPVADILSSLAVCGT